MLNAIFLMEIPILSDLTIILGIAVLVILILHRLKLPAVIGFLISGMICGPFALHLIDTESQVEILAEVGVVLLLFTIGLELSLSSLLRLKKAVFIGGLVQLLLTVLAFMGLSYFLSYDYLPIAIFIGMLFALSSSAIVLKLLQTNGDIKKEQGQIILAILIFQDIAVVPMMLLAPLLAGATENPLQELLVLIGKIAVILFLLMASVRYIIPQLLYQITRTKSKDLFIVSIFVICFAIAWLTSQAGLSLALGAFLAGLIISESKYGYEAAGIILPFKEIFTSIFFVSVGMLLDIKFLMANLSDVLILTLLTLLIKFITGGIAAAALRVSFPVMIIVAINICQVGEFSFVLLKTGVDYGLMPIEIHQYFLAVAVLTMAITPVLMTFDQRIAMFITEKLPLPPRLKSRITQTPDKGSLYNVKETLEDHIVIIGYGLAGQSLASCAQASGIKYVIIELNPKTVREAAAEGKPIIFGDAETEEVLAHARLDKAKAAVITTIATSKTPEIVYRIRQYNGSLSIIARAKQIRDIDIIKHHGADKVIADELESKLETIMAVMSLYEVPEEHLHEYITALRELA